MEKLINLSGKTLNEIEIENEELEEDDDDPDDPDPIANEPDLTEMNENDHNVPKTKLKKSMDWNRMLERYKFTKKVELCKCHVLSILEEIFKTTNFKENLKKGFETCGLCSLCLNNVDYTRFFSKDDKNK